MGFFHHHSRKPSKAGAGSAPPAAAAAGNPLATLTQEEQRALIELLPRIIGQLHREVRRSRDDSTLFLASGFGLERSRAPLLTQR